MRTLLLLAMCVVFAAVGALEAKRSGKEPQEIRQQMYFGAAIGIIAWYALKVTGMLDMFRRWVLQL